nr:hypothetical protein CFP56_07947 [Quercus suber]
MPYLSHYREPGSMTRHCAKRDRSAATRHIVAAAAAAAAATEDEERAREKDGRSGVVRRSTLAGGGGGGGGGEVTQAGRGRESQWRRAASKSCISASGESAREWPLWNTGSARLGGSYRCLDWTTRMRRSSGQSAMASIRSRRVVAFRLGRGDLVANERRKLLEANVVVVREGIRFRC